MNKETKSMLLNCLDLVLQDLNKFTDQLDAPEETTGIKLSAGSKELIAEYSKGVWASKRIVMRFMDEIESRLKVTK